MDYLVSCAQDNVSRVKCQHVKAIDSPPLFSSCETTGQVLCPDLAPEYKKGIGRLEGVQWKVTGMVSGWNKPTEKYRESRVYSARRNRGQEGTLLQSSAT